MSMAFLPEEDVATIPVAQQQAAVEAGVLSPEQPGLAPEATRQPAAPVDSYAAKRRNYAASSTVVEENGRRIQVVTGIDGNITRTDIGPATSGAGNGDEENPAETQRRVDAFAQLQVLLNRYGLGALEGNVRDAIARGITDGDAILFQLRDTETFRTRFKANETRAKKGLPELDPATYIGLEEQYRETLRRNLGPEMFSAYDEPDDFRKLIEGDVSNAELQERINQGYRLVAEADPEVKRQMQSLYNVGEKELVGYFLDPAKGAPVLTRQAQAAQIAARAREQAGFQLGVTTAEDLIARGYTPSQAQQVFEQVGELSGLYSEMTGEQMLTQEQKVGAAFGFDIQAQQELERRRAQRVGEFAGGGSFARTTGATSGTVETGAGMAQ
jgi:hypothetical protein